MVSANAFRCFNFTAVGASHIKQGKPCQDHSMSGEGKQYRFIAVADGHGGEDYFRSDRGSKMATEAFYTCLRNHVFLRKFSRTVGEMGRKELLSQFIKSLILRWNEAIENDLKDDPISDEELLKVSDRAAKRYQNGEKLSSIYGTTLAAFACVGDNCFGIMIGDGECVCLGGDGELFEPIPPDPDCFLNITTSLSGDDAYEKIRAFTSSAGNADFPKGVILCTDGVSNSFAGENFSEFCKMAFDNLRASGEDAASELFAYLPTLSEKGSGDDVSLAVMIEQGGAYGY